jgi:hypothetical protein
MNNRMMNNTMVRNIMIKSMIKSMIKNGLNIIHKAFTISSRLTIKWK